MTYAAAIDIGTHSALLLIAQCQETQVQPEIDLARTTRLGESLTSTQQISAAALERLMEVLKTYQAILSEYPIQDLKVFGTAALRLAENADACCQAIRETFGWSLQILSGEEEADYTFRGISQLLPPPISVAPRPESQPQLLAIDIGGGSTEIITGIPGQIDKWWSIPVGAVLLKQQFGHGDGLAALDLQRMEQFLSNYFASIEVAIPPGLVIVTGGTATTLAALLQELEGYDFRRIDGYCCGLDDITTLFQELNRMSISQRADLPGMEPGRADVILPALVILRTLLLSMQAQSITVTIRGARYGILV